MKPAPAIDIVIFDCDSTLSAIEGIDELAQQKQLYERLAPLTAAAMEGHLALEEIYGKRLQLIRPDRADIDWLAKRYIDTAVSDAKEVIDELLRKNIQVHIVSGGIRQAVTGLAHHLGVMDTNVHAVEIHLDNKGRYCGFDKLSPLVHSGGKKTVCASIIAGNRKALMIGDGITDLEAEQDGIDFIGFGGVVCRRQVQSQARDFIPGPGLSALLDRLL